MAEVNFSRSIYSVEAIKKGIDDYQDLAKFSLEERTNEAVVTIEDIHPSFGEILIDSFCNHVLNETIINRRNQEGLSL